ncbi:CheY-like chemotaxis protein [Haloarcula quadrata]|uniref:CheY-like chemotaxis protein n=1 Tax=Haloarcula quadrata TaxID=182779 RepID=A0A495QQY5_9EURY|nr:response regulator [Haloarcula quadrata]RKS75904.1 CheY-like chemotaxis protein [Haloarcula quadrata]
MSNRIQVLYVEDDPEFAEVTAAHLERKEDCLNVVTEQSVNKGIQRLENISFDCLLSDYRMSNKDGLEFLEIVRKEHYNLPFILFTGEEIENVIDGDIPEGLTGYLKKGTSNQYTLLATRLVDAVERYRASQYEIPE